MERGYIFLFIVFSETLSGLDSWEKFGTLLYIFFHILAKERSEVLQHLLGFLWLLVLDGVFSQFIVISFMFNVCHSLLMLLKLNE